MGDIESIISTGHEHVGIAKLLIICSYICLESPSQDVASP